MGLEVSHDLFLAARLLGGMPQHFDASIGFQDSSLNIAFV
jgi:hypothetical protein